MGLDEVVIIIIASLLLIFVWHRRCYSLMEIVCWLLIMLPVLFFSVCGVTEVVTADETTYEAAFTDLRDIDNDILRQDTMYEYRFTQMTIGAVFSLMPRGVREQLGWRHTWQIYKTCHYFLMFILCLLTACVWSKWILVDREGRVRRITENAVMIVLLGLPLSCLMLKVVNYDSGSTYPAVLGLSLVWAAYCSKKNWMAYIGTLVTGLGVMDKWTALPYWCISVVLFAFIVSLDGGKMAVKLLRSVGIMVVSYLSALGLSGIYLGYAYIVRGGAEINIGNVTFSFVHAVRAILNHDMSVNASDPAAYNNDSLKYIFMLTLIMVAVSLLLILIWELYIRKGWDLSTSLFRFSCLLIMAGLLGGIIAAYTIPLKIAPWKPIQEGYYASTDAFGSVIYHFGCKTAEGHFATKLLYMWAVVVCSYPTPILVILIAACLAGLKKKESAKDQLINGIVMFSSAILLLLYAIAGLPFDARYYSYSIICIVLCVIYSFYRADAPSWPVKQMAILGIVYLVEMALYVPNVKAFSPLWLVRSNEWKTSIRTGEWAAGEAMLWGEDLAVAGRKIKKIVEREGVDYSEVTIYSNYGREWIDNPGFYIKSTRADEELVFSERTYFSLSKFYLYRKEIPPFIYEVEPIETISFKGEVAVWIYRGDQLADYKEYIK